MPLSERQVVRHKLMDMTPRIDAARTLVYDLAYRIEHQLADPARLVARVCLAKVQATQAMQFCADPAVQLLGGMGFMRGTQSERIYREVKLMMIGGGSEEVMKDLAARLRAGSASAASKGTACVACCARNCRTRLLASDLRLSSHPHNSPAIQTPTGTYTTPAMAIIESNVSPGSEAFEANRTGMLALIDRVRGYEKRSIVTSSKSRERFEKSGQLLPRERLSLLLDPGRPFFEIGSLAGSVWTTPTWRRACRAAA